MRVITKNEEETRNIAKEFAKNIHAGEVVLLYGDLGVGKTVFTKALAQALGIKEVVKSPTFNLMKVYDIKNTKFHIPNSIFQLCHIDAYRLKDLDELLDIGAGDYLGKEGVVTIIEWAERVAGLKARKVIKIKITHGKKENERIIEIQ